MGSILTDIKSESVVHGLPLILNGKTSGKVPVQEVHEHLGIQ